MEESKFNSEEYTVPQFMIGELFNGPSGALNEEEQQDLDQFLAGLPKNGHWGEPSDSFFSWKNDVTGKGGDVVDVEYFWPK